MPSKSASIFNELKQHAPFTFFGALTGIACMLLFKGVNNEANYRLFQVFHPAHVFLSALVTVSLYKLRSGKTNLVGLALIGYFGSIGVATLSDCIVPYFGETVLGVIVPGHSEVHHSRVHDHAVEHGGGLDESIAHVYEPNCNHEQDEDEKTVAEHIHTEACQHDHDASITHIETTEHVYGPDGTHDHEEDDEDPATVHSGHDCSEHGGIHFGFIEDWYLVNPAALLGILLAFWIPHEKLHTKIPHASHVLISTWASSFFVLMNTDISMGLTFMVGMFIVLFIAVWLPCCISDIVFPVLFVGPGRVPHCCPLHKSKPSEED